LTKSFGAVRVLDDVSLEVAPGELVALLGPSGSGKTTLLRVIAGMEFPDEGSGPILLEGADVSDVDIGRRRVGFVFQHYALFRHMDVFENIAFGLRSRPWRRRPRNVEIRQRVHELLDLIQLRHLAERYPPQLSGGQRQRVALARALAVEPRVLLLDEPFGALDATVRRELRHWLRRLHDELSVTSIFVTHDQEEALEVADRVAVMNAGRIEQCAAPQEIYERPRTDFVYRFLGHYNTLSRSEFSTAGGNPAQLTVGALTPAGPDVFVRPHEIGIAREDGGRNGLAATVARIGFVGPTVKVELRIAEAPRNIDVELPQLEYRQLALEVTQRVILYVRDQSHVTAL